MYTKCTICKIPWGFFGTTFCNLKKTTEVVSALLIHGGKKKQTNKNYGPITCNYILWKKCSQSFSDTRFRKKAPIFFGKRPWLAMTPCLGGSWTPNPTEEKDGQSLIGTLILCGVQFFFKSLGPPPSKKLSTLPTPYPPFSPNISLLGLPSILFCYLH